MTVVRRHHQRIAVLILAHRIAPLQALLRLLDDRFAVFVHLDARRAEVPAMPAHARLVAPRHAVFWGGWSMMEATLALIAAARAAGDFQRYVLVSGDSLPVVPADHLEAVLRDEGVDHVDVRPVPDIPALAGASLAEAAARGQAHAWRLHNPVAWDHILLNPFHREAAAAYYHLPQDTTDWLRGDIEALVVELLRALRPPPPFRQFCGGAQWWSLTGQTMAALLPELLRADMQRFFRTVQVPDEHMIPTALGALDLATRRLPSPVWVDHARRAAGQDWLGLDGFATAPQRGAHILFGRKYRPEADPAVDTALHQGWASALKRARDALGRAAEQG
jgi:hypothetical protein